MKTSLWFFSIFAMLPLSLWASPQVDLSSQDPVNQLISDPTHIYNWGVKQAEGGRIDVAVAAWRYALEKNQFLWPAWRALWWGERQLRLATVAYSPWERIYTKVLHGFPLIFVFFIFFLVTVYYTFSLITKTAKTTQSGNSMLQPVFAVIVLVFLVFLAWEKKQQRVTLLALENHQEVSVYSAPHQQASQIFVARPGVWVRVVRHKQGFVQVRYPGEGLGWVPLAVIFNFHNNGLQEVALGLSLMADR